jgi:DNA invertase Pin-like site-specific DNA recombinase
MFHIIGAMAEFERDVISERTQAGLDAARARGRRGGRLKAIEKIEPQNLARAKELDATRKGDHYVRCHGPQSKNVSSVTLRVG